MKTELTQGNQSKHLVRRGLTTTKEAEPREPAKENWSQREYHGIIEIVHCRLSIMEMPRWPTFKERQKQRSLKKEGAV